MSTTIRELLVGLGVDADTAEVAEFDAAIGKAKDAMGSALKAAGMLAAGVAVVAGAFAAIVNGTRAAGDEIDETSRSMAMSAREYQVAAFAAAQAGAEVETLRTGLTQLNGKVQEATKEGRDYVELMDGSRMAIKGANGEALTQLELLKQIADKVQGAATAEEKLTIATSLLGTRGGATLIPMLEQGAAGLEGLEARAQALGIVMSDDLVKGSADLSDRIGEVKGVVAGLRNTIAEKLIPVVNDLLTRFLDWYEQNGEIIRQKLAQWAEGIAVAFDGIAAALTVLGGKLHIVDNLDFALKAASASVAILLAGLTAFAGAKAWGAISAGLVAIKAGIAAVAAALGVSFGWAVVIILAVVAAVAALVFVVDDLIAYFRGADSALGTFIARNREAQGVLGAVARHWETLTKIVVQFGELLSALGTLAERVFATQIEPHLGYVYAAFGMIEKAVMSLLSALTPLWEMLLLTPLADLLLGGLSGATDLVNRANASAALAPSVAGASTSNSLAQNSQVNITVNGQADADDIAARVEEAMARSNRDAQAALAGAEV